jgi:D-lactate dehydrogenase (cytochrome)
MVERAIAMDGTCTGEHGVGIGKKEYLVSELGQGTVDLMKHVKKSIDPLGLFNPGKLYPDENEESEHTQLQLPGGVPSETRKVR